MWYSTLMLTYRTALCSTNVVQRCTPHLWDASHMWRVHCTGELFVPFMRDRKNRVQPTTASHMVNTAA